jgi:hypothetical protein
LLLRATERKPAASLVEYGIIPLHLFADLPCAPARGRDLQEAFNITENGAFYFLLLEISEREGLSCYLKLMEESIKATQV